MINTESIKKTYNECLEITVEKVPLKSWVHKPIGVGFTTHKTKYGLATPKGEVLINSSFTGTKAYTKLKLTIFHELSHLIVGLDKNHTKPFKRVLSYVSDDLQVPHEEIDMILDNNNYKYRLIGFSKNNTYDLGGAFNRTKKYLGYDPEGPRKMSIRGDLFLRFEYLPYGDALPHNMMSNT